MGLCSDFINKEFCLILRFFSFYERIRGVHRFCDVRVAARVLAVHVALLCDLLLPCPLSVFDQVLQVVTKLQDSILSYGSVKDLIDTGAMVELSSWLNWGHPCSF